MKYLLKNVLICDGSGETPYLGAILIAEGRFAMAGPCVFRDGEIPDAEILDCSGYAAAPGFIDVHAHSDLTVAAAPDAFSKLSQGITTEISGNCGYSVFPVTDQNRDRIQAACKQYGIDCCWTDFDGYARFMQSRCPAINLAYLCGESTLRGSVCGYENVPGTDETTAEQVRLLEEALEQGALGLSSGLLYVPGKFAGKEELETLACSLTVHDRIYTTHLRSEGKFLEEALAEAIELAETVGCSLEISHFKTAGKANHGKLEHAIAQIEQARSRGVRITADRYPYTWSQTSLSTILPAPYDDLTDRDIQDTLTASPEKCRILKEQLSDLPESRWSEVILTRTRLPEFRDCSGLTLAEIGVRKSVSPAELTVELMRKDAATAMGAFGGMSEGNLERILSKRWVCCGTDESARPMGNALGTGHPRGFGSFPRFIRQTAPKYGLGEAIRRCTGLPAEIFHLTGLGRGRIEAGYRADLVLFREKDLTDKADFKNPDAPAEGIRMVFVNGIPAFSEGKVTAHAGQVLRAN